jgi:hypothetical protein
MTRPRRGFALVFAAWFGAALTSCAALTSWDQYVGGSRDASTDGLSPETRPGMEAGDGAAPPDSTLPDSTLADASPDSTPADTEMPNPGDSGVMGDSATSADTLVPPQDSAPADSTVTVDAAEAGALDASEASVADSAADSAEAAAATFTVGGTIAGLFSQDALQLALNGSPQTFDPPAFTFATPVASGASYSVTVVMNPTTPIAETCSVAMGMGTVQGSKVAVTCVVNSYTVAGTVTGYAGTGLQLSNGTSTITVPATDSGTASFTFPALASGQTYSVTVTAPPTGPGAYCTVSNDSGTIGSSNVTGVQVTCVPIPACSPTCTDGAACVVNGDCGSAVCSGTCQPPGCAPNCDPGSPCGADGDCTSGTCTVPMCM